MGEEREYEAGRKNLFSPCARDEGTARGTGTSKYSFSEEEKINPLSFGLKGGRGVDGRKRKSARISLSQEGK